MKKVKMLAAVWCLAVCLASSGEAFAMNTIQGRIVTIQRVQGVTSGICTPKSVNIRWKPVAGISGYEIYRSVARNGKYTCLARLSSQSQAFMNTSVAPGKEYFYKVRAYTYSGNKRIRGKFSKILRANTKMLSKKKVTAKFGINVRKFAGTNYPRLFGVAKGTKLKVLCETCDKAGVKWYRIQVKVDGRKCIGYIRSDLAY